MLGLTAEQLGTVLLAVSLLITGRLAQQKGKEIVAKAPPADGGNTVELRGAVISDKAAVTLAQSMDALAASNTMLTHATNLDTDAKTALTKALHQMIACIDRNIETLKGNTGAATSVAEQAHDLRDVIGDLAKELEIQSRLRGHKE